MSGLRPGSRRGRGVGLHPRRRKEGDPVYLPSLVGLVVVVLVVVLLVQNL